jgi:hypothetical protein
MTPKRLEDRPDLFHVALGRVINPDHPLARLSKEFDWELIRSEIEPSFCDTNCRPGTDTRMVVGLFYLLVNLLTPLVESPPLEKGLEQKASFYSRM